MMNETICQSDWGLQRGPGIDPLANPSLDLIRAVIEDYLEEARSTIAAAGAERVPVVLLVSDDRTIGAVVDIVLSELPHTLIVARTSADVLQIVGENSTDLIIGEANQNGDALFNVITETAKTNIPLVLLDREPFLEHLYRMHSAAKLPHAGTAHS
jgi:hypothetical protein